MDYSSSALTHILLEIYPNEFIERHKTPKRHQAASG